MSKQTADLLEAFEALAPDEKRIFTAESCGGRSRSIPGRWTMRKRHTRRTASLAF